MSRVIRKYNPGFLSDRELVESFCVRRTEFDLVLGVLRDCTGASNPPQLVIGPRGSGKTTLLLRVVAEVRRDPTLSCAFLPIVFAEESYEVATAGEFWLACLSRLADDAPATESVPNLGRTLAELRTLRDDRALGERCLGALLDFAAHQDRRLVLVVENLNMMFRDMADPDAGWRLRKTLQTESRIVLLASATSRFDEIDDPDRAFYDLFRFCVLAPLDTEECDALWRSVSGHTAEKQTIRSVEILTGGSPRLLAIVARFGSERSFRRLLDELLELVDDHTEYFKSHIESLPAQERRVYLALAELWKPATTREIADRCRLETSQCSAHLNRLIERGVVRHDERGTARRKRYYLTERLYNIYYLLRRCPRSNSLVDALIRFMESYYSTDELVEVGTQIARDAAHADSSVLPLHQMAFERLVALPVMRPHRDELCAGMTNRLTSTIRFGRSGSDDGVGICRAADTSEDTVGVDGIDRLEVELLEAAKVDGDEEFRAALSDYEAAVQKEMTHPAEDSDEVVAIALITRSVVLGDRKRAKDSVDVCEEVVRRFGDADDPNLLESVGIALFNKAIALEELGLTHDAVVTRQEILDRFDADVDSPIQNLIPDVLIAKAFALRDHGKKDDALRTWEDVVQRFDGSEDTKVLESVATALVQKGIVLHELDRSEDALFVFDEVVHRYGKSQQGALVEESVHALSHKAHVLTMLDRPEDALTVIDELLDRFGKSDKPRLDRQIARALVDRFGIVRGLELFEDALATLEQIRSRFGNSTEPQVLECVARALFEKGNVFWQMDRYDEMLSAWDELVNRLGRCEDSSVLRHVAHALLHKGMALLELNRSDEALAVWDDLEDRFWCSEPCDLRHWAEAAVARRAGFELAQGSVAEAIRSASKLLDEGGVTSAENRWKGHGIRAQAALTRGDLLGCERDVRAMCAVLRDLDVFPPKGVSLLVFLSVGIGYEQMREIIRESGCEDRVLPLATALDHELGVRPPVAREVEEVANDIRRDFARVKGGEAGQASLGTL